MADKQSREEKYIASSEALEVRSEILKKNLEHCFSLTPKQVDTVIDLYKEYKKRIDKNKTTGKITLDIDCSNALTGLKAVQREARKATASLKELEEQRKKNMALPTTKEGHRLHTVVIDEMYLCRECGSSDINFNAIKTDDNKVVAVKGICNDCGWVNHGV